MTRAKFKLTLIWLFLLTLAAGRMSAQSTGDELFEKKIRPGLATNCYGCHSSKLKTLMGASGAGHQKRIILKAEVKTMNTTLDHIAPEIVQAIIAQAAARGLPVNDYLRQLLGLSNGTGAELAMSEEPQQRNKEKPQRNEAMFAALQSSAERLKDVPVSGSTEQTLKIIREGRAGAMYGYEPTDTE